jgi:acyl carrier protein
MSMMPRDVVRAFILEEFLPNEDPAELEDTTPLLSGGILDSLAVLKLVGHLEERFGFELAPHEVDADTFDTIEGIVRLVREKLGA